MRVGTRASDLARLQTQIVVDTLKEVSPDTDVEVVLITTGGDKVQDRPIAQIGTRGVFVKELEEALLDGRVDFVVHSLKDMPTDVPPGLVLVAVLNRSDPRDVFVSADGGSFADLKPGARVATSSRRRAAQLSHLRSDLQFVDIRGNVPTRLRKLQQGECDAMILAAAGLLRLGLDKHIAEFFEADQCTPAAGQGALAVECRNEPGTLSLLSLLDDRIVRAEIECERAFLSELGGGCSVPIGALARADGERLVLEGCIAELDGKSVFRDKLEGKLAQAQEIGRKLSQLMMAGGAESVVAALRESVPSQISPP
jgi:hydroxymethylbilane synthase